MPLASSMNNQEGTETNTSRSIGTTSAKVSTEQVFFVMKLFNTGITGCSSNSRNYGN